MTARAAGVLLFLALSAAAAVPPLPALVPYPRQLTSKTGSLRLSGIVTLSVEADSASDRFAAGLLASELKEVEQLDSRQSRGTNGALALVRADSPRGAQLLRDAGITFPAEARDEGYVLLATPRQATVIAQTDAGIFYGAQTLRQMIHPLPAGGATIDAAQIVDWPALRWRGVQIDLSRGPISKLSSIERDIALLAEFKVNVYVMYFENTFDYRTLPLWAAPGGAITPDEAARIVTYAAQYHVTVIPEQEAFGHVHLGLQSERYQDLNELPYGGLLSPAAPGSLDFIGKMFAELAPIFPGPFLHIGADETAELGTGRSESMLADKGPGALYLDYLKAIDQRLAPYHRKVLFWGDIAQAHPELLSQLPKDMIAVPWVYSAEKSYVKEIEPFTKAGLETWVAPGVSNWNQIFPDYSTAVPNIRDFVRDGRSLGSTGIINTNWNDDGESFFAFAWYGFADGAAVGWEDAPDQARFQQAYDWAMYRADGHAFNQQIQDLTTLQIQLRAAIHNGATDWLTWEDAFSPEGQALYARMAPVAHQVRLLAEDVIASLAQNRAGARRNQELLDEVAFGARRFDYVGQKAIYAAYIAQLYNDAAVHPQNRRVVNNTLSRINSINGLLQDLRDGSSSLRDQYRALWLEENTPYFMGNILVRYDAELMYWQRQARRFTRIHDDYAATHTLPPLVEKAIEPDTPR
jgi:hexosaminidase